MAPERVVERLNAALHELFAEDSRLYLLGEDLADPYGGAFKVSRGLSSRFPQRVLSTPLSENAIVGIGAGMALCGDHVIVEMMFGDFIGLAFDPIFNFASKSARMYGRTVPMPLVVRCTVGGRRGYGPTHSQSPQKHFIGVPHLRLFELSPAHEPGVLLRDAFAGGEPAVFFEDKVLYTQPAWRDGEVGDDLWYTDVAGPGHWVRISDRAGDRPAAVLIVPGGMAGMAVTAVRALRADTGLTADILIPGQLYPFVPDPVRDLLATTGRVCVAEESTGGGTWGAEVAARLQDELWTHLRAPIRLVHSAETVIPAAPHLERTVLVQPDLITTALTELARWTAVRATAEPAPAGARAPSTEPVAPPPADAGEPVLLPALNPNDDTAVLVAWLVDDGDRVTAGTPIAEAETSKAINEIMAEHDGVLRIVTAAGQTCAFGSVIGYLTTGQAAARPTTTSAAPAAGHAPTADVAGRAAQLQTAVAAAVTRSHREIPAAFATAVCDLEPAYALLAERGDVAGLDLPALLVKAVGTLAGRFPDCYGRSDGGVFHRVAEPDVAVTVDVGTGLFMPVIRRPGARDFDDVADDLLEARTRALDGGFSDADFAGPAISVSLNLVEGITSVQPIILPPLVCIVSFAGVAKQLRLADDRVYEARVITAGLAYDHRSVNGSRATEYLAALRELLAEPAILDSNRE